MMPTLYVRDFPEHLHSKIKDLAGKTCRSLSAQVIVLIDEALKLEDIQAVRTDALDRIAERRRSFVSPPGATDSLSILREDRNR